MRKREQETRKKQPIVAPKSRKSGCAEAQVEAGKFQLKTKDDFRLPRCLCQAKSQSTGTHIAVGPNHWKSTLQPIKYRLSFCINGSYHILPHIRKLVCHIELLLLAIEFPELPKHPQSLNQVLDFVHA